MNELLIQMLEKAKADKAALNVLKTSAVKMQQFELAANLRQLEKELFPDTPDEVEAKQQGRLLKTLFNMVDLNIPESVSWLIANTLSLYTEKGSEFDLKDAVMLIEKQKLIFGGTD